MSDQTSLASPAGISMFNGSGFMGKNILSVSQFEIEHLEQILAMARDMAAMVGRFGSTDLLKGKILTTLFYEPSTRTFSSFVAAMQRLGGTVIPIQNVQYSSVSKGESLRDTVRTLAAYCNVIAMRHPEVGSVNSAARALEAYPYKVPVINAGDGTGEHPTQAILDIYTIQQRLTEINGCHVVMVGDLKNGRTVHSLAHLLALYDNITITFVSPPALCMPKERISALRELGCIVFESESLEDVIEYADVLYVTRVQKERFSDPAEYERLKLQYVVGAEMLNIAQPKMVLISFKDKQRSCNSSRLAAKYLIDW
ncbi:aspartate carbamoyltransferase, partial [candidate division WWE3 bacterium CG_4_10_14_0_2_um_filter_41_14]